MNGRVWDFLELLKNLVSFAGVVKTIRALANRTIFSKPKSGPPELELMRSVPAALKQLAEARGSELQNVGTALALYREMGYSDSQLRDLLAHHIEHLLEMAPFIEIIRRGLQTGAITEIRALPEPRSSAMKPRAEIALPGGKPETVPTQTAPVFDEMETLIGEKPPALGGAAKSVATSQNRGARATKKSNPRRRT